MIPITVSPKLILWGAVALAVAGGIGYVYLKGRGDATQKRDLQVARQTIKVERETLKITSDINMRVNLEGIQTATTAQEATREIEELRTARIPDRAVAPDSVSGSSVCDDDCARVLQLAREARAAAVASSARLQSARTGAR